MKRVLSLLFVLFLLAGASFAWSREVIAADPNTFNAIHGYAGTSLVTLCAAGNNGAVYRSMDYGKTWTSITSVPIIGTTNLKGVSVTESAIYVAGVSGGAAKCFKSTDWGGSWIERSPGAGTDALDVAFITPNKGVISIISGGKGSVLYTTDGGSNWFAVGVAPPVSNSYNGLCWADSNTVFLCGDANAGSGVIAKSTDGGANWSPTNQALGVTAGNVLDIYFLDANKGFAVTDTQEFFYTTNGGTNWNKYTLPSTGSDYVNDIYSVFATSETSAWITGLDPAPRVIKMNYSGGAWANALDYQFPAGTDKPYDIFGLNEKNMWVAVQGSAVVASNVTVEAASASQEGKTFNRVPQGFGGNITINGNFQIGPTAVAFSGAGVTASGAVTRLSATQLRVPIAVTPTATISNRNITVNINGFTSTLLNGLAVVPGPTINALNPARVYQNWIGTVTATGSAFQVDPGSTIFFDAMTAGTTLELIGTPTIVSTTTAVATVSATDVGNFRLWARNADTGLGFFDFFVVSSFSPPTPESIAFNGITYDATDYPIDGRMLISPTPLVTAIFTDNEQGFNASSQNNAKLLLISNGTLTSIYNVTPESVRLEAGNTRGVIDYQIPAGLAFPSSVNTVQAYMENSSGEAGRVTAKVRIGYAMMTGVPDRTALVYPYKYDPDKDDHIDLQFKMKDPIPAALTVITHRIDGMRVGTVTVTPRVVFDDKSIGNPSKIVKVSLRKNDFQNPHLFANGLLLMIIPEANVKAKVMVQFRRP